MLGILVKRKKLNCFVNHFFFIIRLKLIAATIKNKI